MNKKLKMNKKLQNKLYKKYPKIFAQKDLPMSQTCMCWGIECGDGWYDLIDVLCHYLKRYAKEKKIKIEAVQVKEKFGGLRFYINSDDDIVHHLIFYTEELSFRVCEDCGMMKGVKPEYVGHWRKTQCNKCRGKNGKF